MGEIHPSTSEERTGTAKRKIQACNCELPHSTRELLFDRDSPAREAGAGRGCRKHIPPPASTELGLRGGQLKLVIGNYPHRDCEAAAAAGSPSRPSGKRRRARGRGACALRSSRRRGGCAAAEAPLPRSRRCFGASASRSASASPRAGCGLAQAQGPQAGRAGAAGDRRRMSATLYVLSTLGGYVLTSALLLKCPGLLHRPKRQRFRCRHISHRGGE